MALLVLMFPMTQVHSPTVSVQVAAAHAMACQGFTSAIALEPKYNVMYKASQAMNLAASLVHAISLGHKCPHYPLGLTGYNLYCSRPPGVLTATRG